MNGVFNVEIAIGGSVLLAILGSVIGLCFKAGKFAELREHDARKLDRMGVVLDEVKETTGSTKISIAVLDSRVSTLELYQRENRK
jgi:uncharacterized membrane protein